MKRTLHLRRESLAPLTHDDLAAVAGGAYTIGDHCGPPFDTKFIDKLWPAVNTDSVQTCIGTLCYC